MEFCKIDLRFLNGISAQIEDEKILCDSEIFKWKFLKEFYEAISEFLIANGCLLQTEYQPYFSLTSERRVVAGCHFEVEVNSKDVLKHLVADFMHKITGNNHQFLINDQENKGQKIIVNYLLPRSGKAIKQSVKIEVDVEVHILKGKFGVLEQDVSPLNSSIEFNGRISCLDHDLRKLILASRDGAKSPTIFFDIEGFFKSLCDLHKTQEFKSYYIEESRNAKGKRVLILKKIS